MDDLCKKVGSRGSPHQFALGLQRYVVLCISRRLHYLIQLALALHSPCPKRDFSTIPSLKGLAYPSKTANCFSARLAIPYRGSINPGRGQNCYFSDCRQGRKHRWQKTRRQYLVLQAGARHPQWVYGLSRHKCMLGTC